MKGLITVFIILIMLPLSIGCGVIKRYPAYYGRVIDAETKEPLEGAAVLVVYYTEQPSPGGPVMSYREAQETVTDKDGEFTIPALTITNFKFLHFFVQYSYITIFKPGYGAYPRHKDVKPRSFPANKHVTIELPKLKTREERLLNYGCYPSDDVPEKKYENLFRLIQEERKALGLKPRKEPW